MAVTSTVVVSEPEPNEVQTSSDPGALPEPKSKPPRFSITLIGGIPV